MELCDDGHEEVCFEDRECPACKMRTEGGSELRDAADSLDEYPLQAVREAIKGIVASMSGLTELSGSANALLLTLSDSSKSLLPPWHDWDSLVQFRLQVVDLGKLLNLACDLEHSRPNIDGLCMDISSVEDQIREVKNTL